MSNAREIRSKIKGISNTKKITSAMEMVAASKMRKAQDRMFMTRPYVSKISEVIQHMVNANLEFEHTYLKPKKDVKKVGLIVVSTDRGLCGGLNINLFKKVVKEMAAFESKGVTPQLCVFGSKAESFFKQNNANIIAANSNLGDKAKSTDVIGIVNTSIQAFEKDELDEVYLVYNKFENTMVQKPSFDKLLPITQKKDSTFSRDNNWDYLYEPKSEKLLGLILKRYIESAVFQAVVENFACEQAARMMAMKSATDNASDLIDELKLKYNKARQSAITQELSEIVAGASAV